MLKNAKQPGKERERDFAQVGVDMSPPEISYEIVRTASGRNTGQLKIVVTDKQSGVDAAATVATNASGQIQPGVPVIQQVLTDKEKVEPKRQVRFYQLLFPDFLPTETQAGGGDFRVAAEGEAPAEAGVVNFGSGQVRDNVGIPFQIAYSSPTNPSEIEIKNPGKCVSGNGTFKIHKIYDFDSRTVKNDGSVDERPDLTLVILPSTNTPQARKATNLAKHCLQCNAQITSTPITTNLNSNESYSVSTIYDPKTGLGGVAPNFPEAKPITYQVENRQGTANLLIQSACKGNLGCAEGLKRDESSFYVGSKNILAGLGPSAQENIRRTS